MNEYTMITYRLNRSVKPTVVLQAIEEIMQIQGACYHNCLFKMNVLINEYEFEGTIHSNRRRNAVLSICKANPAFEDFCEYTKEDKGEGYIREDLCISNFSDTDYSPKGTIEYPVLREVITQIPRPYGVSDLELIFNDVCFSNEEYGDFIRPSQNSFGSPIGNYIRYNRSVYGDEKHSHVFFTAAKALIGDMRGFFFDFSQRVPGKYEGVELNYD